MLVAAAAYRVAHVSLAGMPAWRSAAGAATVTGEAPMEESSGVEASVARLVAIEEIKQLKARYCRALDRKDWALMREVFTADAVFGPFPPAEHVLRGPDDIAAFLERSMATVRSVHQAYMPEIELESPVTARGTWAMRDLVAFDHGPDGPIGVRGFGHYHERYECENGRWSIASLRLDYLQLDPLPGGFPAGVREAR